MIKNVTPKIRDFVGNTALIFFKPSYFYSVNTKCFLTIFIAQSNRRMSENFASNPN